MAKNDTKLETKIRTRDEVLADLKSLIRRPGYIYSLCIILFNDFHLSLEELGTINNREKLSIKEVALILGYLIQEKIDLTYPETTEYLIENKNQTYELLEELHFTFMVPQREMLAEILNKGSMAATPFTKFEFFTKKGSMQESIFYAGDGAYDLQYIEYLPQKYGLDQQWLKENRDFDFNEVSKIINSIRQIQLKKVNKTKHVNLRNPEFVESIKKYIKGRNKDKKLKETLALMEFMQFYHLFPQVPEDSGLTYSELEELYQSKWNIFYDNLLDLFILDYTKLSDLDGIDSFFTNFGVISPEQNKDFKTVGDYNILNSRPIIHLPDGRWFLPLYYLLAEAVYESPFYWMCEDKEYIRKALHNRGKVGEDIVYNLLKPVFGNNNVFQSVKIKTSREKTATDIDVLCLLGNKALCVQVKSKKMTIAARRGEIEALVKDFKGAFQDAYEQGLKCSNFIESKECTFLDNNGNKLQIPEYIKDVYIMGVTTENYPAIVHNSYVLLKKDDSKPNPLFISVFDLELLTHYLKDPYDFMYYVRQRILLMDYFRADEEMVYLGYHLLHKLWRDTKYDFMSLESDFGNAIDRNYYPYKLGVLDELPKETDDIANSWRNADFDRLCSELKSRNIPGAVDIIFALFDLCSNTREDLLKYIKATKKRTLEDNEMHSFAMPIDKQFGISFVSIDSMSQDDLETKTSGYAHIKKYMSKADCWLGLGSYPFSPNIVDCFYYDPAPWIYNEQDEQACAEFKTLYKSRVLPINGNKKIGRNDPCPCGSGQKYKKCCGKH